MTDKEDISEERLDKLERLKLDVLYEFSKKQGKQKAQIAVMVAAVSIGGFSSIAFDLFNRKTRPDFGASEFLSELFRSGEVVRMPDFEKAKGELLVSLKQTLEESAQHSYIASDNAITSEQLSQLDSRVSLIEKSISDNPERALSIPLLRRDQDELNRKLEEFRISAKVDSDRLWSQQNTILQGIGALLLAVAVAAVTILYRAIKPNDVKLP